MGVELGGAEIGSGGEPAFRILGNLEVWHHGRRLGLGGPRQERVLAALLVEPGRVIPLSRLVDAAWEDLPSTAAHQIRETVGDLRRRPPDGDRLIRTDGPGYRLTVPDEALDLRLWRGAPLSGMDVPVLRATAAELEERGLAATERLAQLRLELGEAADLVGPLRALVAEHPLREALWARLMVALHQSGRQAEAMRVYADGRSLLVEELGINPGPMMAERFEQILRNDPELDPPRVEPAPASREPAATARPETLPYDVPDCAGRDAELAALLAAVEQCDDHGLATPPGSRCAEISSRTVNRPVVSAPSTNERHHHRPRGRAGLIASRSRPAGSTRKNPSQ
ncbi:AfsR/SARP family transcriptional regulator [Actinokineospora auranticolor]|uniref:DNA-binding SARP family transcriptional activator n=1 Tax=Actinokineospora auranticolor TaxID=155976 RepID=A0A2S6GK67_9PSEU|nr:AfsR/SARP family transcriptional regulator [Actinokineospora auranticolor]PPK65609.1 DNA-binding SARP family transcriptional activator [Actinokineospora auranticolor]